MWTVEGGFVIEVTLIARALWVMWVMWIRGIIGVMWIMPGYLNLMPCKSSWSCRSCKSYRSCGSCGSCWSCRSPKTWLRVFDWVPESLASRVSESCILLILVSQSLWVSESVSFEPLSSPDQDVSFPLFKPGLYIYIYLIHNCTGAQ